ncbi:NAD(P)-binding protein [Hygrophoropsis aurantiaca]|uniref:NAD(P)-binding protein n=1 Tax=Hygrophoropsis aurantiaca TaxID=72124 RepID=A0ACB8A937_9AGAM|nr:NAD(P)-binding protein [Hygrophoropsis aurantiaca]
MATPLKNWLEVQMSQCPWACAALLFIGGITLTRFVLKTLTVISQTFVFSGRNLKKFGANKGSWAVVTGASDGIGREFAIQLAKAGFNVMLVARNKTMLESVAADISTNSASVETKIHLIDLGKKDQAAYDALRTEFADMDIGVLVNNAGKSHDIPTYFVDAPEQEVEDILSVNINALVRVTQAVLPGMTKRKRGLILNLGSFAGMIPSPMLATYSGTKSFVDTFTSALAEEVRAHGIVVQHLNTYFVVSKMSNIRRTSVFVPSPAAYVRSALSKITFSGGAAHTDRPDTLTPYWSHALLDYAVHIVGWKAGFVSYTHRLHKDIRRRALRKLERLAKKE